MVSMEKCLNADRLQWSHIWLLLLILNVIMTKSLAGACPGGSLVLHMSLQKMGLLTPTKSPGVVFPLHDATQCFFVS